MKRNILFFIIIAVIVAAGVGYYFWAENTEKTKIPESQTTMAPTKVPFKDQTRNESDAADKLSQEELAIEIRQAISTLNKAIEEKNDPMRNKMYFKFRLIEQDYPGAVAPYLIENLNNSQEGVTEYTAFILGWIDDKRAVPHLRKLLSGSEGHKRHASRALGFMRASEALDDIIGLLNDENVRVRQDAAYSLGLLGDDRANKALKEAENDPDELVRFFAKEAVERIENYKKYGW
ncbi:HEAT repeat domain-containing protein [bacterium]|nr:HEAT repeat domain-containing protein [candidate division CSSED10-310 bacterium]